MSVPTTDTARRPRWRSARSLGLLAVFGAVVFFSLVRQLFIFALKISVDVALSIVLTSI